jgi:RHS repeat-associated protein
MLRESVNWFGAASTNLVVVTFSPMDTTPPTGASFSPAMAATNVSRTANVTVTFSEAVDPATVNGSTVELRDPSNALVSATVSYNVASLTATLNPTASLALGTTYTARVRGGGTDPRVKDVAGNALAADVTWTFTTAQSEIKWLVTDHLGSTRMVIDETGSLAGIKRHDFAPFGEELFAGVEIRSGSNGYSGDSVRQKFTGHERDETGLDFAQARYFASLQGRFTSPDSVSGELSNPQTLNLYAYVQNNPLAFVDPTGHMAIATGVDPLTSTHTDRFGNVVAVYNDGDFGVYLHESLDGWDRQSKLPTSGAGVILMGYTLHWDEFAYLDEKGKPVEGYQADRKKRGRIMFGESWDETVEAIQSSQLHYTPDDVARMSRNGQPFDIKENKRLAPYGHFTGKRMTLFGGRGYFVSAKSVGNFMVGHYAGIIGLSQYTIMNLAGALQQKQWRGVLTGIDILQGKTFGPPPYYGETEYAGRMIETGHRYGRVEKENPGYRLRLRR